MNESMWITTEMLYYIMWLSNCCNYREREKKNRYLNKNAPSSPVIWETFLKRCAEFSWACPNLLPSALCMCERKNQRDAQRNARSLSYSSFLENSCHRLLNLWEQVSKCLCFQNNYCSVEEALEMVYISGVV